MKKENKKIRADGLTNALMSIGYSSTDKRRSTNYQAELWTQQTLTEWYIGSDIFSKIVDEPVEAMTRNGFKVFTDDRDITGDVEEWFKKNKLNSKIETGLKWASIYGGAGLLLGLDDAIDQPTKAFNPKSFKQLKWSAIFDRFNLVSGMIDRDPSSDFFKKPKKYTLNYFSSAKNQGEFHASRLIRFEGVQIPDCYSNFYQSWGDSILTRTREPILAYAACHNSTSYLLQETGKMKFELNRLYEMFSMNGGDADDGKGTEAMVARLKALELSSSVINGFVMGEGEKAERLMINFSGIPEMLDKTKDRLATAADLPHTILFNESPSGLGATGNSELTHWYEKLSSKQESVLRPILEQLIDLYFLEKGKVIPKYSIKFNPLTIPTATEIADIQTKRVTNVRGLFQDGFISEQEGMESLVDEDDPYSLDIEYDPNMQTLLNQANENPDPTNTEGE